jgi:chromosome partitioning protein
MSVTMQILMFAKQKGGVGASTLAREIGALAAAGGGRVVFVDLDPQASLSKWWNRRTAGAADPPNPALAATRPEQLLGVLSQLRASNGADLVVIDVPPSVHGFLFSIMQAADVIVIPVRPTADDFEALPDIVDMVERAGRRYAFVVTQAPTGKRIRAVEEAVPILARQGRVAGVVRFRAAFPAAGAAGLTAVEYEPGGRAAAEIAELWDYVGNELRKQRLPPRAGLVAVV